MGQRSDLVAHQLSGLVWLDLSSATVASTIGERSALVSSTPWRAGVDIKSRLVHVYYGLPPVLNH